VSPIAELPGVANPGALTVTAPVAPDTVTFVPATILVTPELVTVGVVVPLTLIPVPAVRDCTPVADTVKLVVPLPETLIPVPPVTVGAVTVTAPVAAETLTPDPARLVTPVLLTVKAVVPDTDIPVPANTSFPGFPEPVPKGPLILLALVPVADSLGLGPGILLTGGSPSLQT
jgi:hypothetical protein